ncbi:MAG: hypothetical protein P8I94_01885 [Emcibacteraceae bacterium]|nr:hypothetical protein [Emcibacteraceae bacterium]
MTIKKHKKPVAKQILFEVNSYSGIGNKSDDNKLFIERDDAILYMIELSRQFESNTFIDGVKRLQKQYHDLDGYLVCLDLFVDEKHIKLIQLSEYKAY